jgi:DNA repair protein RadA/Sms
MMKTKERVIYRCRECGAEHHRWQGRCDDCGEWSSLEEEASAATGARSLARPQAAERTGAIPLNEVVSPRRPRLVTGLGEFDRVLGGGLVAGSAVLVAGDPGIGKSTLLLQASGGLAAAGHTVLYASGEESPSQTRLRAARLGIDSPHILLLAETELEPLLQAARERQPDLLVVDSIQTLHRNGVPSAPGSVTQVRECAGELTIFAKETGIPVVLIGHVTKTGDIAGPRLLSHVVDAVLSFEGDRYHTYRVIRAVKNRFGATEEIGLFEMQQEGLEEVANPAGLLPGQDEPAEPGSVVVPAVEGTRVLLVEIQALASRALEGAPPRRRATGLPGGRLDLLLAVLAKKGGGKVGGQDIFVNAVGGVRVSEPGADLAVLLAVASSVRDKPFPRATVAFGEVGLRGEIRPVSRGRARLAEAARLGFGRALVPPGTDAPPGIAAVEVRTVREALSWLE